MKNKTFLKIYLTILAIIALITLFGPLLVRQDPNQINLAQRLEKPSSQHLLGTDGQGRDVLARIIYGARISLGIGLLATLTSLLLGVILGLVAGYCGGLIDRIITALIDITLSFPSLLLAIGITVVFNPSARTVVLALTIVGWASLARFTRGLVINLRYSGYIESAKAIGLGNVQIMLRHLFPNCLPLIIIAGFLRLGTFILSEASLSFLGLGVPPPTPTWGSMINFGREYVQTAPWIVIFPGLALALTVISCNLLGDSLRDFLDPKAKKLL